MKRQKGQRVADPAKLDLTDAQWRELRITGCVITKDGRIIRTLAMAPEKQKR